MELRWAVCGGYRQLQFLNDTTGEWEPVPEVEVESLES